MQLPSKIDEDAQEPQKPVPAAAPESQAPIGSNAPSETSATLPATPSTPAQQQPIKSGATPTQTSAGRPVVPVVPIMPMAKSATSTAMQPKPDTSKPNGPETEKQPSVNGTQTEAAPSEDVPKAAAPAPRAAPKSWADLVRSKGAALGPSSSPTTQGAIGPATAKNETLGDVLNSLGPDIHHYSDKVTFVEPRGLVNTGNMCYMNSVSIFSWKHNIRRTNLLLDPSNTCLLYTVLRFR